VHDERIMEPSDALQTFRRSLYECLPRRSDALFELADAILCADGAVPSPAHLSLQAPHRRGWGSLYAALWRGRIDAESLRRLLARHPLLESETPRSALARLRQALRPGAHLPLLQAEHGMDHAEGAPPRAGRSMDVAGFGSFHPAQAGAGVRCGPKATVGAPLRRRSPDTGTGPPGRFVAFGAPGHARQAAETLRQITRQAQRQSLGPGDTLPDDKEGSLKTQEDGQRGFCDELYVHRKTPPG
jgi:DDE superfamily endonuclease